ncbi:MAG: M50 family metallopeptidase [Candidatus Sericytochromatia bacterium]|nr:M50 family metallopeptidase [Candidatus Sericytochromatia bacterium]
MALSLEDEASGGLVGEIQRHALWVAGLATLAMTLLHLNLWIDQIFVTFIHEACHGLAAVLTGGTLVSLAVEADTSGRALTQGGFRPLILVAGYAGSCVWGAALLLASRLRGAERLVCWSLALFLGGITVFYVRNPFGFAAGLALAAGFGFVARRGAGWQLSLLLAFLALRSLLASFEDLWTLIRAAGGPAITDADLMSRELTLGLVPPIIFAGIISAVSVVCGLAVLQLAWRLSRPEVDQTES